MIRIGVIACVMIIAFQGFAFGQGLLDSVLGPGGLGLWSGDSSRQFNPQGYQGPQPQQQQYYQPPAAPGQQYPQAAGYPQQYYGQQQGVYSDWQNQQPAVIGSPDQYGASPQYPEQQQYAEQPQYQQYPAQQQYPPQQQYQQQYPPQQQQYAPPQQQYAAPQVPASQPRGPQQPLRPGQYSPAQGTTGPGQVRAEDLPPGAVRMTVTTPEGTTVQYYPPTGEPDSESVARPPRQKRPAAPKPTRAKQVQQQTEQTSGVGPQQGAAPIAMPKPVEIPKGQDPRYGWGAAVDRAPSAPPVR